MEGLRAAAEMPPPEAGTMWRSDDVRRRPPGAPDIDIYRSAATLIKRYGEDAPIQAGMRVDALLDESDLDGQAVWRQILAAIEALLRKEPGEGEGVH